MNGEGKAPREICLAVLLNEKLPLDRPWRKDAAPIAKPNVNVLQHGSAGYPLADALPNVRLAPMGRPQVAILSIAEGAPVDQKGEVNGPDFLKNRGLLLN